MKVDGQRQGRYNLEIINNGRPGINLIGLETNAGSSDLVRHGDNTLSITFDKQRKQGESFTLMFADMIAHDPKYAAVHNLPIRPGATLNVTIDWKAFWADQPALTIAVDDESDGQVDHSRKIGRQPEMTGWSYEISLTPDMPEYRELFGAGAMK